MKKLLSAVIAIIMVCSTSTILVGAFDQNAGSDTVENTLIKTFKPSTYTVIIPENGIIDFNVEKAEIGTITLTDFNLQPNSKVEVTLKEKTTFSNDERQEENIPYILKNDTTNAEFTSVVFEETTPEITEFPLSINITKENWATAKSGNYSTTLTFAIAYTTLTR